MLAEQQAVLGVPGVELVTFDVAGGGQLPAALIDEQALAEPKHRPHMGRVVRLGGD
jgi:hypothetical protein